MTAFRTATRDEVQGILDWAHEEGWNPGLEDAQAFYAADPEGFFLATDDGRPVAAISVVNHSDSFAFLGLYLAVPEFRGRGIGYALWQHAISHAGGRCVGLDGVAEQQANYAKSGFVLTGGTTRFSGAPEPRVDPGIRMAGAADMPDLIESEAQASGTQKTAYLSAWFGPAETRKTLIADGGFCTVRQCRSGVKIGPLIADDIATAEGLIRHAATVFAADMMIYVPDSSDELGALCRRLGLSPGFQTARMYRAGAPTGQGGIYAVTSLELG